MVELGPLVDHHCHGLVRTDLDRAGFEAMLNEADRPSPLATSLFDSMLGLAVRRWCAPVLDLEPHVAADAYLARRRELGVAEVNRRLVAATGIETFLVDTGLAPERLTPPDELAALAGATAREVVRLETTAQDVLAAGVDDVAGAVVERLRASGAVAAKSIAAYRVGLDLPAAKPTDDAFRAGLAATDPARLAHRDVSGWLAWTAVELGLPLQLHVGYGDNDVDLAACDPLRLTAFLRATQAHGVPVLLLHNYPFHRHAAYLAQVFDQVFMDVGLAVHNTGALSGALLRESLELVPFGKLLFSSDAFGLAELYHLSVHFFRRGLGDLLDSLVGAGEMSADDAAYAGRLVARGNARRAYGLDAPRVAA